MLKEKCAPTDAEWEERQKTRLIETEACSKAPMWGIFFAILPALGFAVLGFFDQNLRTLLVNRAANNLKKPPAYHLDMLMCGAIIYPICTILSSGESRS